MSQKILTPQQAISMSQKYASTGKKIVLVGGCFDILHVGHILFLKQAKALGDELFVLLESDASITKSKGSHRPINIQQDRASVLAALEMTDVIVLLEGILKNEDYDELILKLKPAIIATNEADQHASHKKRQAEKIGGTIENVGQGVENKSTSHLARLLQKEL